LITIAISAGLIKAVEPI